MLKRQTVNYIAALVCLAASGCTATAPTIPITVGSESVRVIVGENTAVPEGCIVVGPIEATDGMVGTGRWHYEGSEDRAIVLLRNSAVRLQADTVRIEKKLESLERSRSLGYQVWVYGTAYRCN